MNRNTVYRQRIWGTLLTSQDIPSIMEWEELDNGSGDNSWNSTGLNRWISSQSGPKIAVRTRKSISTGNNNIQTLGYALCTFLYKIETDREQRGILVNRIRVDPRLDRHLAMSVINEIIEKIHGFTGLKYRSIVVPLFGEDCSMMCMLSQCDIPLEITVSEEGELGDGNTVKITWMEWDRDFSRAFHIKDTGS